MLKDKIVLILGGVGHIGSAIADLFEKNGATVCRHGLVGDYAADVSKSEEAKKLIEGVIKKFGRIDILVNSVSAPAVIGSFDKKSWADFSGQLNVQLKSAVEAASLVLPGMKQNNFGRIINIASEYSIGEPPSSLSDYVTAKYALVGFTKALAKEVGKLGITVNAISPSLIKNEFSKNVPEKLLEILAAQSPSGKLTVAEDVAREALNLVSGLVNGENILIVGGKTQ